MDAVYLACIKSIRGKMHTDIKLIKRRATPHEMDSVGVRQEKVGNARDLPLLERIEALWEANDGFRRQYARGVRFAYGDQWGDLITVNGKTMTQRDYLRKQGNVVLQTNQIKNKVDTIAGVLIKEQNEPVCIARDRGEQVYGEIVTEGLKANCDKNKLGDLYIKWMKDLCLGGLAVCYESWDATSGPTGRLDSWSRYCNPNAVFFDSEMNDPRFWDLSLVGQFFDLSFEDLCARFAKNEGDYTILRSIYADQSLWDRTGDTEDIQERVEDSHLNFRMPADRTKCRVYEVWTKETKARIRLHDMNNGTEEIVDASDSAYRSLVREENLRRRELGRKSGWADKDIPYITGDGFGADKVERNGFFIDEYWYCRFLAPDGEILWEGESPYADRLHPFSICATPFVGGKIVGYMNDAIDHNIAINRAIVLHDWLTRSQAKGVTVVPKSIVPADMSFDEFAESWTSVDDVVFIDVKPGQEKLMPQIFHGASQTFDVSRLINTYSQLMENSTAVTGAIQGKTPYSGTSGELYAQMSANASTPIAALLSQFYSFLESAHAKKMKNIAKFYTPERWEAIVGDTDIMANVGDLRLNDIADMEFDLAVRESTATPTYRAVIRDDLKGFLAAGFISFDEFLEMSDMPYAEELRQKRQAKETQQIGEGGMPETPPEDAGEDIPAPELG